MREHAEKIANIEDKLQRRLRQQADNPQKLPEAAPGDDVNPRISRRGHRRLINMAKANLRKLKWEYFARCGGPMPPVAQPAGSPETEPQARPSASPVKVVVLTGGGLALGYLAFRVVRLLLSLAPPLWPTLVLNLLAP